MMPFTYTIFKQLEAQVRICQEHTRILPDNTMDDNTLTQTEVPKLQSNQK